MLRHLMLLVLVACSSKTNAPAPNPTPAPTSAPAPEPTPEPTSALSFVPDELVNELAGANLMLAINFEQMDLSALLDSLPPYAGCAHDLVSSLGVVVILAGADGSGDGYATKLPERATRACLDQLMPVIGGSTGIGPDGSYEVRLGGDNTLALTWKFGIVTARPLGALAVRRGPPSAEMRALIGHVPATAKGFFLAMAFPKHKVKNVIGWGQIVGDTVEMQLRAEGTELGAVQPWLQGVLDGFTEAAAAKQAPLDERWFDKTLADPLGKIEGRVPVSVFRAAAQRR